jgi:hypothetical protein
MVSRHRIVVALVGEAPLRTEGSTSRRLKNEFLSWSNRSRVASVGDRPNRQGCHETNILCVLCTVCVKTANYDWGDLV